MVSSDDIFVNFVEEAGTSPTASLAVMVFMTNPRKLAKVQQAARLQQDALAMRHGPNNTRLALERTQARLVVNPHTNVDEQERIHIAADLHIYITRKYGQNSKSMRIKEPNHPGASIRVTWGVLTKWSHCIMHKILGIDQDNPPNIPKFVKDKRLAPTLAELAAKQGLQLSKHKSQASPTKSPVQSTTVPKHLLPPPKTPAQAASPSKPLATSAPRRGPAPIAEKKGFVLTQF
ncbi:hypothetical protein PTTG_07603 [Puccinia triticina 1-1 BBBD Race 1]|uniref:Uncharacterized protein n=1 Tax=Puccinia triticina (isolate 1-1 / race 1 (BBBD)) TaxID=630390 RepID=A0A180GZZ8_PUCT1|nr:hypothetical protein PTTG_07603 [Puccinia triticina 1-1 BBBD Race 1]